MAEYSVDQLAEFKKKDLMRKLKSDGDCFVSFIEHRKSPKLEKFQISPEQIVDIYRKNHAREKVAEYAAATHYDTEIQQAHQKKVRLDCELGKSEQDNVDREQKQEDSTSSVRRHSLPGEIVRNLMLKSRIYKPGRCIQQFKMTRSKSVDSGLDSIASHWSCSKF